MEKNEVVEIGKQKDGFYHYKTAGGIVRRKNEVKPRTNAGFVDEHTLLILMRMPEMAQLQKKSGIECTDRDSDRNALFKVSGTESTATEPEEAKPDKTTATPTAQKWIDGFIVAYTKAKKTPDEKQVSALIEKSIPKTFQAGVLKHYKDVVLKQEPDSDELSFD